MCFPCTRSQHDDWPVLSPFVDGKYLVLPSGELHIKNVTPEDGKKSYSCRTVHRLTGETRLSATAGRLVISGKRTMRYILFLLWNIEIYLWIYIFERAATFKERQDTSKKRLWPNKTVIIFTIDDSIKWSISLIVLIYLKNDIWWLSSLWSYYHQYINVQS